MVSEMVNIDVSEWVKAKLEAIKKREQHKSMDSVLRTLLAVYEGGKEDERREENVV